MAIMSRVLEKEGLTKQGEKKGRRRIDTENTFDKFDFPRLSQSNSLATAVLGRQILNRWEKQDKRTS